MKRLLHTLLAALALWPLSASAQQKGTPAPAPKLVVGIVVDQMRYDYLTRYWDKLGKGGFRRLVDEGYFCRNTRYNYAPTETGPGHASIYTGTYPAMHGIVANDWYDRSTSSGVYCVSDTSMRTVGADNRSGQCSPKNLLVSTLTDELRLASNMGGRVYTVSIKDRGAVLPAGHLANGAFWMDVATGHFVSSSFYMQQLPDWVQQYNKEGAADRYLESNWETLLPLAQYTESLPDENNYETLFPGEQKSVFPHNIKQINGNNRVGSVSRSRYDILRSTPFGNTMVRELGMRAIKAEKLGKGPHTDLISISFSSTDIVAHLFGPASVEVQDIYLRLDQELETLIDFLDKEVGREQYVIFLSADHGGSHVPAYLRDIKMPAGYFKGKEAAKQIDAALDARFGAGDWIAQYAYAGEVYLNRKQIADKQLSLPEVQQAAAQALMAFPEMRDALTGSDLSRYDYTKDYKNLVQNGFYERRSPDVMGVMQSGYADFQRTGTTHGAPYSYDTHIPLIFFGWKVKPGYTHEPHYITEIAPTVSTFLNITAPTGSYSTPVAVPLK